MILYHNGTLLPKLLMGINKGKAMRVLLHICCAPCCAYTFKALQSEGMDIVGFWFNPNIHPYLEYRRRLDTLFEFSSKVGLSIVVKDVYAIRGFLSAIVNVPVGKKRCEFCYRFRLERAAKFARERGFDGFTTTLLYSKYQRHELIKKVAEEIASEVSVPFIYRDFRVGWQEGKMISKKLGLYRQKYCGCVFSEYERFFNRPVSYIGSGIDRTIG